MVKCACCRKDFEWDTGRWYCANCLSIRRKKNRMAKYVHKLPKKLKTKAQLQARKRSYDKNYWQRPEVKERNRLRAAKNKTRLRRNDDD